jgi:hypothetical protein
MDIIRCASCNRETYAQLTTCPHCNKPLDSAPPPKQPREEIKHGPFVELGTNFARFIIDRRGHVRRTLAHLIFWVAAFLFTYFIEPDGSRFDQYAYTPFSRVFFLVLSVGAIPFYLSNLFNKGPLLVIDGAGLRFPHRLKSVLSWGDVKQVEPVGSSRWNGFVTIHLTRPILLDWQFPYSLFRLPDPVRKIRVPVNISWPHRAGAIADFIRHWRGNSSQTNKQPVAEQQGAPEMETDDAQDGVSVHTPQSRPQRGDNFKPSQLVKLFLKVVSFVLFSVFFIYFLRSFDPSLTAEAVITQFNKAILANERLPENQRHYLKWNHDITVSITGKDKGRFTQQVKDRLQNLGKIAGIGVRFTQNLGEHVDLDINLNNDNTSI